MIKYSYDFLETVRGSRLAFHAHPLLKEAWTPHVNREPDEGSPAYHHYRWYEVTIYEALEDHMAWWASDAELSCENLKPLLT